MGVQLTSLNVLKVKNKNNTKDRPFINRPQHNPTISISKTKQTITKNFIFSHFHANYCTGGKPIQKGDGGKKLRFFFFAS